jgi:site-specific DNA-methyltransferase (adenine-specific)/site-specific DNA-methyltransferase (cytosine-N4-specific)
MAWQILEGDCVEVMRTLPPESVDAVITSPPYAMQRKSTYGGVPEADYPAWTVAWMNEARRLMKPDGSVIINIRPHIKNGQISDYTLRTRLALREAGWCECEELIWRKPSAPPAGRIDRPRRTWESLHWFALHGSPYANPKAAGTPRTQHTERYAEMDVKHKMAVCNGWDHGIRGGGKFGPINRVTDVIEVSQSFIRWERDVSAGVDHPAAYPSRLAEWVGKLICPQGGTILDPFSGSASTGVACIRNGWDYIGIEAMPEYAEMSRRRLEQVA